MQLLARIKGSEKKYVEAALKDENSDIRITGLRIARELKLDVIPYVKQLASDPSAQVRRECAIALRHNPSPEAPKLWAELAAQHDGKDRWYLEALGIGADKQEEKFFAAWLDGVKGEWNTPTGRDIVWRSRATKSVPMLVKMITAKEATQQQKDRGMRALEFISGPERSRHSWISPRRTVSVPPASRWQFFAHGLPAKRWRHGPLLPNAELAEDRVEQIFRRGLAHDFADGIDGDAQIHRDEVQRLAVGERGDGVLRRGARAVQRVLMARVDHHLQHLGA